MMFDLLKYFIAMGVVVVLICCLSFFEPETVDKNIRLHYKAENELKQKIERGTPNRGW